MGDVVPLVNLITTNDIPPEKILQEALKAKFKSVIVVGITEDDAIYLAHSEASGASVVMDLELAKATIIRECLG